MHPRSLWIVLGLLTAVTAQSAVIYKWTDAKGVVHYSDQPVPGAERIITAGKSSINTYSAQPGSAANGQQAKPGNGTSLPAAVTISSPQPDQNFFNDEPINVSLSQTTLKPDQSVTWHLNGKELTDQSPSTTLFVLPNPGRGTFVIAATVTNQTSGEVITTPSVTFYVREPSLLSPQHRNP
jgi:Domain of unknown function (DUF4124)